MPTAPLAILLPVTAPLAMLPVCTSNVVAATALPLIATKSATSATTIAGDGRRSLKRDTAPRMLLNASARPVVQRLGASDLRSLPLA